MTLSEQTLENIRHSAQHNLVVTLNGATLLRHIDAQQARIAELELDKQRIDYLHEYGGEWDAWTLWTTSGPFVGDGTLRSAIDEAIDSTING